MTDLLPSRGGRLTRLMTLGHGTASAAELAELITDAQIELMVDVRTIPNSRRHPQFRREEMERWVPQRSGSEYSWKPALGGFRRPHPDSSNVALRHPAFRGFADYMETTEFSGALKDLLSLTAQKRVAIMCSETVWWRCHRRLISDAAVLLHHVTVEHLMQGGKARPHIPTAGARVTTENELRYDILDR